MKQLIALLIVLFFLMGTAPAAAQGGTPLAPPPGSSGPSEPLPPLPVPIGQPIPKAPEQYLPTWIAPPPAPPAPAPTIVPSVWNVLALAPVPVYMAPALNSYVLTTLPSGTIVAVRWAGPGWLQLQSGYAMGSYIKDTAPIQRL